MKNIFSAALAAVLMLTLFAAPAPAQQHHATHLGNPATRFATPLQTPEDFRAMLRSEKLRADVEFIARESGFKGDMADLLAAATNANIIALKIPTGTRLPAMSTRKNGKPELLRDVLWAGKEAFDAYEFYFTSQGRRYRCISPKPCANFWIEDYGKELKPALALDCDAPGELLLHKHGNVCLTVKNTGDDIEPLATVALPLPASTEFISATEDGKLAEGGGVTWQIAKLAAGGSRQVCATFAAAQIGSLNFNSTARGQVAAQAESHCGTEVKGVPAVLLEVVDVDDPIEVGKEETYEITVLNQGTAALTNVKAVCTLPASQEFISGTGTSAVTAKEREVTLAILPELKPKDKAVWRVTVKALAADDARFATVLTADQFPKPITEDEATQQY